ncbi:hypothetical protein QBC38DRAFT_460895 [Podospora fimiseda]|uniref:Uncharacterized protein n=1 Tax=Podospora fimiseda TaxID=252190 RepID=A0AAN6YNW5_9PEZI|nr:hypothetical protein QBC38DRAFT_460895 [Podospora fimiseda]
MATSTSISDFELISEPETDSETYSLSPDEEDNAFYSLLSPFLLPSPALDFPPYCPPDFSAESPQSASAQETSFKETPLVLDPRLDFDYSNEEAAWVLYFCTAQSEENTDFWGRVHDPSDFEDEATVESDTRSTIDSEEVQDIQSPQSEGPQSFEETPLVPDSRLDFDYSKEEAALVPHICTAQSEEDADADAWARFVTDSDRLDLGFDSKEYAGWAHFCPDQSESNDGLTVGSEETPGTESESEGVQPTSEEKPLYGVVPVRLDYKWDPERHVWISFVHPSQAEAVRELRERMEQDIEETEYYSIAPAAEWLKDALATLMKPTQNETNDIVGCSRYILWDIPFNLTKIAACSVYMVWSACFPVVRTDFSQFWLLVEYLKMIDRITEAHSETEPTTLWAN